MLTNKNKTILLKTLVWPVNLIQAKWVTLNFQTVYLIVLRLKSSDFLVIYVENQCHTIENILNENDAFRTAIFGLEPNSTPLSS